MSWAAPEAGNESLANHSPHQPPHLASASALAVSLINRLVKRCVLVHVKHTQVVCRNNLHENRQQ